VDVTTAKISKVLLLHMFFYTVLILDGPDYDAVLYDLLKDAQL
jgi:hypothetical protein